MSAKKPPDRTRALPGSFPVPNKFPSLQTGTIRKGRVTTRISAGRIARARRKKDRAG